MCGLFGFSGWDKANLAKLKILGLYNKTRGRDSCGYYFNNQLVKGVGLKKEWDDFIEEEIIDSRGKGNVFIGHCRQGTVGASTLENAHPFDIHDKMILAHNGTLDNHFDMCREYDIDHSDIKVDSLALGHLLLKIGAKQILKQYRGYAALLIHLKNEPDSLFIYHGASRVFESDDKLTEERPLFMMKTAEGIYFSSMIKSLQAIRNSITEVPTIVPHNQLIKVTNGKLAKSWLHIDRGNTNVGLEKKNTCGVSYQRNAQNSGYPGNQKNSHSHHGTTHPLTMPMGGGTNNKTAVPFRTDSITPLNPKIAEQLNDVINGKSIWLETKPIRCFQPDLQEFDFLYYHKGRYFHSDGNDFAEDVVYCDSNGVIYDKEDTKVRPYYFYRGVKLKSFQEYEIIQKRILERDYEGQALLYHGSHNFAQTISKYASYPVTCLQDEGKATAEAARKMWWFEYKPACGSIQPVWSDRNYVFAWGNLKDIVPVNKNDVTLMPLTNASGKDLWVNKDYHLIPPPADPQQQMEFTNGEVVLKDEEKKVIGATIKWFDRPFTSVEQALSDAPSLVWDALLLYFLDINTTKDYAPEDDELIGLVDKFLGIAINDNVTFRENMESDPVEYVRKAYKAELKGNKSNVLKDLEEINLQWKELGNEIIELKKKTTTKQAEQMEILVTPKLLLPPSTSTLTLQENLKETPLMQDTTTTSNEVVEVYIPDEVQGKVIQMKLVPQQKSNAEKEVEDLTGVLRFMGFMSRRSSMLLADKQSNIITDIAEVLQYSQEMLGNGIINAIRRHRRNDLEEIFQAKRPKDSC